MLESTLAFAGVAALLTITPGIDSALVMRTSARLGRRSGILTAIGICCGLFAWGTISALGVATIFVASPLAYRVLKFAGAAVLMVLGVRSLISAVRDHDATENGEAFSPAGRSHRNGKAGFYIGFVTNILNPKIGIFYVSVLPQFVHVGDSPWLATFILVTIHALEGIAWLMFVAWAVHRIAETFKRPGFRRGIEGATAGVLVCLGVSVAVSG